MKYLDEIKAREKAASPGPWYMQGYVQATNPARYCVAQKESDLLMGDIVGLGNAALISNARTDIPRLLRIIDKLRGVLEAQLDEQKEYAPPGESTFELDETLSYDGSEGE